MTDEAAKTGEARHCTEGGSQSIMEQNQVSNPPSHQEVAERLAALGETYARLAPAWGPEHDEDAQLLRTASDLILSQAGAIAELKDEKAWLLQSEAELEHAAKDLDLQIEDQAGEIERLRKALEPFARYSDILGAMGGNMPKKGTYHAVSSAAGEAEITVEDFKLARALLPGGEG